MTHQEILTKAIEKYYVTKKGEVFSRKSGKQLKCGTYNNGYKYICFYVGSGVTKKIKVHRMVAYTFIPNPENKPHINHKNCNPSDNRVENLEWCTAKENVIHGFKMGRKVWNKGMVSKSQIFRLCKREPRKLFWYLTTNEFLLAKAFWGEEKKEIDIVDLIVSLGLTTPNTISATNGYKAIIWRYHLQQMVLEEDPVKYLEKFL